MSNYDLDAVRREFPVTSRMLYLDSAFQTPLATSVRARLLAFYDEAHLNAGPKSAWIERLGEARAKVARLLGVGPDEIAFTKNTSEGLNAAANALPWKPGDNVLLVEGEHPNNTCAWLNLQAKGLDVRIVPQVGGWIDAATFAPHVDERTRAIALSHVMFHSGQRNDIDSVGALCRKHGLTLVVDAMQSAGVIPVAPKAIGAQLLAAGAHKALLATQGLGILYCSGDVASQLQPVYCSFGSLAHPPDNLIVGPGDLELDPTAKRFEIGNFNYAGVHALSAALDLLLAVGVENVTNHVLELGDRLIGHLDALDIGLVGPRERAHRSHIYVLDLPHDRWIGYFADNNVRVSAVRDGIRVSFALFNTVEEVDRLAQLLERNLSRV